MQNRVQTAQISSDVTPTKFVSVESNVEKTSKPINVVLESDNPSSKVYSKTQNFFNLTNQESQKIISKKLGNTGQNWDQVKLTNDEPLTTKKMSIQSRGHSRKVSQQFTSNQLPLNKLESHQEDQRLSSAEFINKRYQIFKKSKSSQEFLQNIGILEKSKPKSTRPIEPRLYERLNKTSKRLHSAYQYVNVPTLTEFKINQTQGWNQHIRKDQLINSGTLTIPNKDEKRLDLNKISFCKKRISSTHSKKKQNLSKSRGISTKQQLIQEEINRINNEIELQKKTEDTSKKQRIYIPSQIIIDTGIKSNNSPQQLTKRYNDAFHNKAQKAFFRNQEAKTAIKKLNKNIIPITQELKLENDPGDAKKMQPNFDLSQQNPNINQKQKSTKIMVDLSFLETRDKQMSSKINLQQNMMLNSKRMADIKIKSKFLKKQMTQEEADVAQSQDQMLKINRIKDYQQEKKPSPIKIESSALKSRTKELGQDINFILETSQSVGTQIAMNEEVINTERDTRALEPQSRGKDEIYGKNVANEQILKMNELIQVVNNEQAADEQPNITELHSTNKASIIDSRSPPKLIESLIMAKIEKGNVSDKKFIKQLKQSRSQGTLATQLEILQGSRNKNIHISKMFKLKLKQQFKRQRQNNPTDISETINKEKAGIIMRRVSHTPDIVNQLVQNAELRHLISQSQRTVGQKGDAHRPDPTQVNIFDNKEIMLNFKNAGRTQSVKNSKLFTQDIDVQNQSKVSDGQMRKTSYSRLANHNQEKSQQMQQRCRTANILRTDFDDIRVFQEQTPFFDAFGFSQGTRKRDLEKQKSGLKIKPINPEKIERILCDNFQVSARIDNNLGIQEAYNQSHINLKEYCVIQKRFKYQPEKCLKTIFSKNRSEQALTCPGSLDMKPQGLSHVMRNLQRRITKHILPSNEVTDIPLEKEKDHRDSRPVTGVSRESQQQKTRRLNEFVAQMKQMPFEESGLDSDNGEDLESVIENIQRDFNKEINEQVLKNSRSMAISQTASAATQSHVQTADNIFINQSKDQRQNPSHFDKQAELSTVNKQVQAAKTPITIGEGVLFKAKPGVKGKKALRSSEKRKQRAIPPGSANMRDMISLDQMQRSVSYRGLKGVIRPKTQNADFKQMMHQDLQQRYQQKISQRVKDNAFDSNYMALSQTLFCEQSQSIPNIFSQQSLYYDNQNNISRGQNKNLQTQDLTVSRQSSRQDSKHGDLLGQSKKQRISVKSIIEKNSSPNKDPARKNSDVYSMPKNADYSTESVQENTEQYPQTPTLEHFQMLEKVTKKQAVPRSTVDVLVKQLNTKNVDGNINGAVQAPTKLYEIIQTELKTQK